MSRPEISVVMPFAGDAAAAIAAIAALLELDTRPGDELILADNCGCAPAVDGIRVLSVHGERSPAHARNRGAEQAGSDWILFLDADCRPRADLLDVYFAEPVPADAGALAGEVLPAPGAPSLIARYGAVRSFLSQEAHLAHPYRPRAVAANLLVRRLAFEQAGGFYEGVRAAEDTDFSWRIQEAGWRLELRRDACVEHRYRATLNDLRRQWRGYAAGRAWLARRYEGFEPEPALRRALRRASSLSRGRTHGCTGGAAAPDRSGASASRTGAWERGAYLVLDALLGVEELAGMGLSNRPGRGVDRAVPRTEPARVVLVADRFPARGDPLAQCGLTLHRARIEAVARPEAVATQAARQLDISYREDDGAAAKARALAQLAARHPVRCAVDLACRPGAPTLAALAPAVLRLEHDRGACVRALCGDQASAIACRLAALAGRQLEPWRP